MTEPGRSPVDRQPGPGRQPGPPDPPVPASQPQWGAYRQGPPPPPGLPGPALKPGVVALGPMNLGSILGAAFTMFRFNPKGMVLLPLALYAVLGALSVPVGLAMIATIESAVPTADPVQIMLGMLPSLLGIVGLGMLSALAIPPIAGCVHAGILGRRLPVGVIWAEVSGRIPAVLGYTVLLGLLIGLPGALPLLPMIGIVTGDGSRLGGWIAIMLLLLLAYLLYAVWLGTKTVLAGPAIVIEELGPITAVRRSFRLTQGAFWPVLGTYLLGSLIAAAASQIVSYALSIPLAVASALSPGNAALVAALSMPIGFLTMAITMPFTYAVVTLIYVDRRIKAEGYEVELIDRAAPSAAAPFGPAAPAPPGGTYPPSWPQQQPPRPYPPQDPTGGQHWQHGWSRPENPSRPGGRHSRDSDPSPWQRPEPRSADPNGDPDQPDRNRDD